MNENQEIKRTSKSHLKALVKKGREQAQKEKEADDRDRAERAIRRKTRQGSNYDPSEDDLEDSYSPEGEETLNEKDYGKLIKLGVERAKQKRLGRATARQIKTPNTYREIKDRDAEGKTVVVKSSYEPEGETLSEFDSSTTEFVDRVMNRVNEGFDKMTAGELEDYDNNANKPKHGRKASQQERKEMAAKFRKSRGGASTKTKQGRDLRLRKAK